MVNCCFTPFPSKWTFETSSLAALIALRWIIQLRELSGLGQRVPDEPLTQLKYFNNAM